MRDILVYALAVALCLAPGVPVAIAQDAGYKEERAADKQAIEIQKAAIKENAAAARQEEVAIKEQIRAAEQSGDMETVKNLKEQLRATRRQNMQERQQDRHAIGEAKKEMRQDRKEARQEGNMPPPPRPRRDIDNNPPGPRGGPGAGPKK